MSKQYFQILEAEKRGAKSTGPAAKFPAQNFAYPEANRTNEGKTMGLTVNLKRYRCSGYLGQFKLLELMLTIEERSYALEEAELSDVFAEEPEKKPLNTTQAEDVPWRKKSQQHGSVAVWRGVREQNSTLLSSLANNLRPALGPGGSCGGFGLLDKKI
ncbi:hypothetical protein LWC08_08585 [Desulfobaculum bizertense]|uniref:hypothetical protein n=1 Tax=Desulfobaculum bizertense TaxID=376490 RepID=UPI001F411DDE|nr:hypothetical protein [Desulfobaculum bizertense]UIJ36796.1 hypothetical protein LWC08_08585 [Desulfobaculum bizertense]